MIIDPIGGGRFIIADNRVMQWVASRIDGIPDNYEWPLSSAIGLVSSDGLIAGMVVHDFSSGNCQLTFAASSPKWATKASIRALLRYPFEQLGCNRVTAMIRRSNVRSIRFNKGIGFVEEGVLRQGADGEDVLIYGLLREETPEWMGFTQTP